MKILVLGGCGFLGSYVVDELIARGREVVVVDDLSTAELDECGGPRYANSRAMYTDILGRSDLDRVEGIAYLALRHPLERDRRMYQLAVNGYVLGGFNLLMDALDRTRVPERIRRFVLAGPLVSEGGAGEARLTRALRDLVAQYHRPPELGIYCAWFPELTGDRRTQAYPLSSRDVCEVGRAAELVADLVDGTRKHRVDIDLDYES